MLHLHTVLAVDRAGLVGEDGETHHGVFDVGFLRQAPGLKILCPASCKELEDMLNWAVCKHDGPVAVRYPRGSDKDYSGSAWTEDAGINGGVCVHRRGEDVTIITYGTLLQNAMDAAAQLHERGVEATVLRLLTVAPLPISQVISHLSANSHIVIMEEACASGVSEALACGIYEAVAGCRIDRFDLRGGYVTHGSVSQLYRQYHLDGKSVSDFVLEVRSNEN